MAIHLPTMGRKIKACRGTQLASLTIAAVKGGARKTQENWDSNFSQSFPSYDITFSLSKLWKNKKGRIFVWAAPKMVSFFSCQLWKRPHLWSRKTKLGPSYFVRALVKIRGVSFYQISWLNDLKWWGCHFCDKKLHFDSEMSLEIWYK